MNDITAVALEKFDTQMRAWRSAGKTYAPIKIDDLAAVRESIEALVELLLEWESTSGAMLNGVRQPSAHPYRQGVQSVVDDVLDFLGASDRPGA